MFGEILRLIWDRYTMLTIRKNSVRPGRFNMRLLKRVRLRITGILYSLL